MKKMLSLLPLLFLVLCVYGQGVSLQGYVFESNNRGYIRQAKVDVLEATSMAFITSVLTDKDGFFKTDVPPGRKLLVRAGKDLFLQKETTIDASDKAAGDKVFVNLELDRKPGYIFDVTLANPRDNPSETTDGIHGATVEVFNNTTEKEEVRLVDYEYPNFKVNFEQGNHYTILVRKEGYYAKRMEAYVNVKGCILCFDGIGSVRPGVSDVLTAGHQMGTLLANVEMKPIVLNEQTKLENITYAVGSAALNEDAKLELQKVADLLKNNPGMKVELSSHTDSRGKADMNMKLSQERARIATEYVASFRGVEKNRILARGYGETRLDNGCADGVECNERQHRRNRRTVVEILEFNQEPKSVWKPLAELKRLEKMEETLLALQNQEVIQIPADAETADVPDDLKKQLGIKEDKQLENAKSETPKPVISSRTNDVVANTASTSVNEEEVIEMIQSPPKPEKSREQIEQEIEERVAMANAKKIEIVENESEAASMATKNESLSVAENKFMDLKNLPSLYNGFMIQVHESAQQLPASHQLFQVFGNLTLDKTPNGFGYLMGDFKEAKDAQRFLNTIIKPRYPKAKLVKFEAGRRLVYQG